MQDVLQCNAIKFSDVTLDNSDDNDNSDLIECDQEMIGREFFDVTIATDDRNKDSVISDL